MFYSSYAKVLAANLQDTNLAGIKRVWNRRIKQLFFELLKNEILFKKNYALQCNVYIDEALE